jgi:hypothetical protein
MMKWRMTCILFLSILMLGGLALVRRAGLAQPEATVAYATYFGGSDRECFLEQCLTAVDGAGNIYLAGTTNSRDLPLLNESYGPCGRPAGDDGSTCSGNNGFVAKFDSNRTLLYSSHYPVDTVTGVAPDGNGGIYVTGYLLREPRSVDGQEGFPVTGDAFQDEPGGGGDAYLMHLNGNGSVTYATYLGGSEDDRANDVALQGSSIYLAGYTESDNFPTSAGAFQPTPGEVEFIRDAFVTRLDSMGRTLGYSSYLGGEEDDIARAIAVDAAGQAYLTGNTDSADFPKKNALQGCDQGRSDFFCQDAFVTKLTASGDLLYSTHIDGPPAQADSAIYVGNDIAARGDGSATMVGSGTNGFVIHLSPNGDELTYITELGDLYDTPFALALDGDGVAYVAGASELSSANEHPFLAVVGSNGQVSNRLLFGGSKGDQAHAVSVLAPGHVVVAGSTASDDFGVTPDAFQSNYAGPADGVGDAYLVEYMDLTPDVYTSYLPFLTE